MDALETYDASKLKLLSMNVVLLWTTNGFPAYVILSWWSINWFVMLSLGDTHNIRLKHDRNVSIWDIVDI